MNSVQLIGRLIRDPEAERTAGGVTVATFRLAVDRPGRDDADFVTVKCWHRLATAVTDPLRRGRRVAVDGRLEHSEWTTADHHRLERLVVVANQVEFLDPPSLHAGEQRESRDGRDVEVSGTTTRPAG